MMQLPWSAWRLAFVFVFLLGPGVAVLAVLELPVARLREVALSIQSSADCWDGGKDFQRCCLAWDSGQDKSWCWPLKNESSSYARCCLPQKNVVVDLTCDDKPDWRRLRKHMLLSRPIFAHCTEALCLRQLIDRPQECVVGALTAALALLSIPPKFTNAWVTHLREADFLLRVLLKSPLSARDILASGWPLGDLMAAFQSSAALAYFQAECAALSLQINVSSLDVPRAWVEVLEHIEGEHMFAQGVQRTVGRLLSVGYSQMRRSVDTFAQQTRFLGLDSACADPLFAFAEPSSQLATVLSYLQGEVVLSVDPFADLCPEPWKEQDVASACVYLQKTQTYHRPLYMRVLPYTDFMSSSVRFWRRPLCTSSLLLPVIAAILAGIPRQPTRNAGRVRFWEVGANLGDCTLLAAALLHDAVQFASVAFEPIPDAASAFRWSVSANRLQQEIYVADFALGSAPGVLELAVPDAMVVNAGSGACPAGPGDCQTFKVALATMDSLIFDATLPAGAPRDLQLHWQHAVVDMVKIIAMGHELEVLRGSRRALQEGRICVVLLDPCHLPFAEEELLAMELLDLFQGYQVMLAAEPYTWPFADSGDPGWKSGRRPIFLNVSASANFFNVANRNLISQGMKTELLAWHDSSRSCRGSLAVAGARRLVGS
ncbi:unnamed protein product [Polarella glacialis]|uniref:Methyltransferase FkbM domain-containing protein n=1 Tax=Polarella glacialis TaxID=89957 RepID=A0A813G3G5_POLGL|nr:unnamed protein product [Polarella glacialis]